MNVQVTALGAKKLAGLSCDALLVVLTPDGASTGDKAVDTLVRQLVKAGDLELKAGQSLYVHSPAGLTAKRLVLVVARDASAKALRSAMGLGLAALKGRAVQHLSVVPAQVDAAAAESVALALEQAYYVYQHTKPSAEAAKAPQRVSLCCAPDQVASARAGLAQGQAIAEGVQLARECGNRPGNHCTPSWLASRAQQVGRSHGFSVKVLERKAIEKLGMGAFLSVARGSEEPPRFIVMEYSGGGKKDAPVVLVGKGITFDSGGISLKPAPEMDEMKFDMGGAAAVLGAMSAVARLQPKINVVGLIPTCENMPSGHATKPGDVVTSMSGQTIEILNTDAEGRLILCDALTFAQRYKPAAIVDVATLTGACVVALGHHHAGMYASDDTLAQALLDASVQAQDPCWRMPLDDEYADALKSNFADVANVGVRAGGSITAAKFLQRFVGDTPWAHLDVAGVAHRSGAAKGATGRPVGLLTHFVLARAAGRSAA